MPDRKNYNLDYQPESYWGINERNAHIGAGIKGELRRQAAKELATAGIIDPVISVEILPYEQLEGVGALHPWLMGGEFLPDLLPNEIEIARVTLKSTTMDVISIRARRVGLRIAYRIVDEYSENSGDYRVLPKTSDQPLTLRQLIRMIDKAQEWGLNGNARYYNFAYGDPDPELLYDFATVSSEFYPELAFWYDEANEEWLAEEMAKIADF